MELKARRSCGVCFVSLCGRLHAGTALPSAGRLLGQGGKPRAGLPCRLFPAPSPRRLAVAGFA